MIMHPYLIISRHVKELQPRAANQNNPLGGDKISDSKTAPVKSLKEM